MSDTTNEAPEARRNDVFKGPAAGDPAAPGPAPGSAMPADEFGFVIPVASAPLPSGGKIYPPGSPLHGLDRIEIRSMTTKDEDILTSRALVKNGTVLTKLIQSCIIDKRIDPRQLILGDRNAVMTAIRVTGYGQEYTVEVTCPECGKETPYPFDLAALPIKKLEIDPVEPGQNLFHFKAPVSGVDILWRFTTGADEEDATQAQAARKKTNIQQDSIVTENLMRMIVSINGITDRSKLASGIPRMPSRDSKAFRHYVERHEPGIEMKSRFVCPACGEVSNVEVPISTGFFWPSAEES